MMRPADLASRRAATMAGSLTGFRGASLRGRRGRPARSRWPCSSAPSSACARAMGSEHDVGGGRSGDDSSAGGSSSKTSAPYPQSRPASSRLGIGGFDDDGSSAGVNEDGIGAHPGQRRAVDHAARALVERDVERDVLRRLVRTSSKPTRGMPARSLDLGGKRRDDVVVEHTHLEAGFGRLAAHPTADPAEADDARGSDRTGRGRSSRLRPAK